MDTMFSDLKHKVFTLADNFFCLAAPNKSRFPFCNGFLLIGNETILIDTGLGQETLLAVDKIKRIDTVIFTHSHPDHILNWHLFRDRQIWMPEETPTAITDLHQLGLRFMGTEEKAVYWAKLIGDGLGLKPFREPDMRFKDKDIIESGPFRLKAIHAPGHLSDHYCFLEENSRTLITGDIDFSGFGPFYGQPECNIKQFMESIHNVMMLPYIQVCSSHRSPFKGDATGLFEKFAEGFERHSQAILDLLKTPQTIGDLAQKSPIYKGLMPDKLLQETFETGMISKNIAWMIESGRVLETDAGFIINDIPFGT